RKKDLATKAQQHFATALGLYGKGAAVSKIGGKDEADRASRANEALYAIAESRFHQAQQAYQEFLGLKFPENLVLDTSTPRLKKKFEESKKKFAKWNEDKQKTLEKTRTIYGEVITFKQAHWAIAAAARIGQLFADYADQLFTAPIPPAPPELKELAK